MSFFQQIRSILGKTEPVKVPQAVPAKPEHASPESLERRRHKRLNTHKGRRVLIIDDSPTIVAALRKMLRSAGCITLEALNAEKGLELVRDEKPDLVFLDIVLPGMNGFAALRLMRRDPLTHHIPVIMISGNEQATEQFYAKRIGADDFMKKPFSRYEVFARIESLVELNKLARLKASTTDERQAAAPAAPPVTPRPETQPAPAMTAPQQPGIAQEALKPLAPVAITQPAIPALEARKQLTEMGLQYFNQEQFLAAIQRGDKLALELFIAGGGVNIDV